MDYPIITIQSRLQKKLSEKRFIHSLGVQYTATALAMIYDCDLEKASIAGLLHDCAKHLSDHQLLEECIKNEIPVSEAEHRNLFLLHSKVGAFYASKKFKIYDTEILDAIRFHTTGRPRMNLLEKIIFTADYIEPNRKIIPGLIQIRKMAFVDLDAAVALILKNTIEYLKGVSNRTNISMDEITEQTYEFYKRRALHADGSMANE